MTDRARGAGPWWPAPRRGSEQAVAGSGLKVLIIGQESPLCTALGERLTARPRSWLCRLPGEGLEAARAELGPDWLVVDLLSFQRTVEAAEQEDWTESTRAELLASIERQGAGVLMLSHASVFPWRDRHRWAEEEAPEPHDAVGQAMHAWERQLEFYSRALLLRAGQLVDASESGMLQRLHGRLLSGGALRLPTEPRQAYTSALDLARVISAIIDQLSCHAELWGTYHYQAAGRLSQYELAEAMLTEMAEQGQEASVVLEPAGRPQLRALAQLSSRQLRNTFGIQQRILGQDLKDIVKQLGELRND